MFVSRQDLARIGSAIHQLHDFGICRRWIIAMHSKRMEFVQQTVLIECNAGSQVRSSTSINLSCYCRDAELVKMTSPVCSLNSSSMIVRVVIEYFSLRWFERKAMHRETMINHRRVLSVPELLTNKYERTKKKRIKWRNDFSTCIICLWAALSIQGVSSSWMIK